MPSATRSSDRSFWSRLSIAFCALNAAGVLLFFVLRALLPLWPWPLAMLNNFVPFLFAPLLLTLPLALLTRSKGALLGSLAVLGLFFASYGHLFLPRIRPAVASADATLTVMTFNVFYDHPDPEQAVLAIEAQGADIVAVQELLPHSAELLRRRLSHLYPHMLLEAHRGDNGLLSRYPILHSEWFHMAGDGKTAIYALLDVNGAPVHVFAVHPPPPGLLWPKGGRLPSDFIVTVRDRQILDVARRVADVEGTIVVLGDLNATDQSRAYGWMCEVLQDAYREAGWGFGFTFPHAERVGGLPIPGPLLRIDYVFHSDDLYAERARVECKGGSNHCYLVAQLTRVSPARP